MSMGRKEGYYFVNELFNEKIMLKLIDKETWKRKPYFDHCFNQDQVVRSDIVYQKKMELENTFLSALR